jgi:alkylhydroperoxidase family enzyme
MELTKLSLLPFFLLASVVASVTGDELRTFIVHVQPSESLVFETADDRAAWYEQFLPEEGRLRHAYHHVASGFAARLTQRERDAVSVMPGFVRRCRRRTHRCSSGSTRSTRARGTSRLVIVAPESSSAYLTLASSRTTPRSVTAACRLRRPGGRAAATSTGPRATTSSSARGTSLRRTSRTRRRWTKPGTALTRRARRLLRSCQARKFSARPRASPPGWRPARTSPCTKCSLRGAVPPPTFSPVSTLPWPTAATLSPCLLAGRHGSSTETPSPSGRSARWRRACSSAWQLGTLGRNPVLC